MTPVSDRRMRGTMSFSNPWFTAILVSMLALHVLEVVAVLLDRRRLTSRIPDEFVGFIDPEHHARSLAYIRESGLFDLIAGTVRLAVFLVFWLAGGFAWLDGLVRSLADGEIARGLLGFSLLHLGSSLVSLPFEVRETFGIEARYGFNRTTPRTFVMDRIKGLLLAAVIGLPLLALVMWICATVPLAWLWAWVLVTLVMLALQFIAPRWLMPLFNEFKPLADGHLKSAIHALGSRCGLPVGDIFVIDGSLRSSKANAFFAGFGRNKRVALYDTLIEKHPEPELLAVLAHEIGHFRKRHIWMRLALAIVQIGLTFFLLHRFLAEDIAGPAAAAFGLAAPSFWLSFVFFMILFEPCQLVLSILANWWSRRHEFEADAYAAAATGGPEAMVDALRRLARDSMVNLTPHPLHVVLHASHPSILRRIAALRSLTA